MRRISPCALQALENRGVLGIHRQNPHALLGRQGHDEVARGDQGLFICQGNVLPRLHSRHCGADSDHAHHSGDHNLGRASGGSLHKAFHPPNDPDIQIPDPLL